ncbi:MAG: DUF3108 domain-containing protein [Patescibacteria group bacterium]
MLFTIYFLIFLNLGGIDSEDVYSVRWRCASQDFIVGALILRTDRIILNGKEVYDFSIEAKNNDKLGKLKPFCITMESWAEVEGLQTLRFEKFEDLQGRQKKVRIFLDQFNNQATWGILSTDKEYLFTREILSDSKDLLTLFHLLKSIPVESLEIGKLWLVNMIKESPSDSDSTYSNSLPVVISAIEKIKIKDEEIECFVFEVSYKDDFLGSTEKIKIWLSKEHQIIMLKRKDINLILNQE